MKIGKFRSLIVAFLIFSALFIFIFSLNSAAFAPLNPGPSNTMDRNDPKIHAYFNKIAKTPYNEKTNNCKTKSEKFAKYLARQGAEEVYIVEIQHENGVQFHECIQWQGKIYDPTLPVYAMDEAEYFDLIKEYGLSGLKFISLYS